MDKILEPLKDVVERQVKLLEVIKELEKSKNDILCAGKFIDFSSFNQDLSTMIAQNNELEEEREKVVQSIQQAYHMDRKNFSSLIDCIPDDPSKRDFECLYERLKKEVGEIKYLSKINQELIQAALEVIDLSLEQEGLGEKDIDYTQKSETKKDKPLLINKLI